MNFAGWQTAFARKVRQFDRQLMTGYRLTWELEPVPGQETLLVLQVPEADQSVVVAFLAGCRAGLPVRLGALVGHPRLGAAVAEPQAVTVTAVTELVVGIVTEKVTEKVTELVAQMGFWACSLHLGAFRRQTVCQKNYRSLLEQPHEFIGAGFTVQHHFKSLVFKTADVLFAGKALEIVVCLSVNDHLPQGCGSGQKFGYQRLAGITCVVAAFAAFCFEYFFVFIFIIYKFKNFSRYLGWLAAFRAENPDQSLADHATH